MADTQLTPRTFAEMVGDLDDHQLAQFVADLYEESGWEVRVEDTTLTASRADEETKRLLAVADDRSALGRLVDRHVATEVPDDVDEVVFGYRVGTTRGEALEQSDVETVGVDDLYHQVLYAMDRERGLAICERHLPGSDDLSRDAISVTPRQDTPVERLFANVREHTRGVVAVTIVALVIGVVTIGVVGLGGGPEDAPGGLGLGNDGQPPATPVGLGASVATQTPGNRGIQTATVAENGSGVRPRRSSYYFNDPQTALLTYIKLLDDPGNEDDLQVAWRTMSEETRPQIDDFVASVRNGSRRWTTTLSATDFEVEDSRATPTNGPGVRRGFIGFFVEPSRAVYQYVIVCQQHDEVMERGCWQIARFSFTGFR